MMKNHLSLLPIIVLVYLSSCASSSYFEPTPLAKSGNAMVYIFRPAGANPGKKPLTLSYPEIIIDGLSVGLLKYKKYLAVEVSPGQRQILVTGLTKYAKWEPRDLSHTLEMLEGKSYFLRYRVEFDTDKMSLGSFNGQYKIYLTPVDEIDAVYEIRHSSKATAK